ncbi:hypothetical protein LguiA_004330 [Lonicera macranthoides]
MDQNLKIGANRDSFGLCMRKNLYDSYKLSNYNYVDAVGSVKINVDTAFNPISGWFGVGVICRDERGRVIGATAIPVPACLGVVEAEALAVLEGLRFASLLGLQSVKINSDSLRVVNMVLSKIPPGSDAGVFILDFLDLAKSFSEVSCSHVLRSANEAANSLAAFAIRADSRLSWGSDVPDWLSDLVLHDLC